MSRLGEKREKCRLSWNQHLHSRVDGTREMNKTRLSRLSRNTSFI